MAGKIDVNNKVYKLAAMPFLKINRKMFERQVQVHRERLAYLEDLKSKGSFDGIILPPTILDAMEEVEKEDGKIWSLTQVSHTPRDMARPL